MPRVSAYLFLWIIPLFLSGNSGDTEKLTPTFSKITKKYDRKYNDLARYLAAMPEEKGCVLDKRLLTHPGWKTYCDTANADWDSYYAERILPLREWAYDEIGELNSRRFKFFYPFSGPDILHGNMFFRNADTTIMFGLEPVGKVPLLKTSSSDSIDRYIRIIQHSLHAILNYSFFRTLSMKQDLRVEQTGGTLPLLMLFLARTGNRVLDVKGVFIDKEGKMQFHDLENAKKLKVPGVEITYCQSDSTHESKLYYFSADISNKGLHYNHPEFHTYLKGMGPVYTFIKSASYLMYNDNFSSVRNLILGQSLIILQDDSGIPHSAFQKNGFDYTMYGMYNGTISLFSSKYQTSLYKSYQSQKEKVKPLSFGIGYKYKPGESNLVLYRKLKT
ncbi:MAG: hypothetical protein IT233_09745 [Bacteroidia bacterium]|nr:hypothetical protein [Bacteroidia bacterium]